MPEPLSFARDLPLTQAAIAYAADRHGDQRRAADGAPFVVHPLEVASLLERSSYPDHVIAAAVLHDVLEDTDAESSELRDRFGAEVCELVSTVSDDPAVADEEARKDTVRERVPEIARHARDGNPIQPTRFDPALRARGAAGTAAGSARHPGLTPPAPRR